MEVDTTQFNDIYKEMAELLGDAAALKMWNSGCKCFLP